MKRRLKNKALTIFGLYFLLLALIIGISFLGINQLLRSNSIGGDVFAQGINKEIYPLESSYKLQENMLSLFRWNDTRQSAVPKGVYNAVEPVFIYKDGRLKDPSEEIGRLGFETFSQKWFEGKVFPVYCREREVGTLSDFSMKVGGSDRCKDELWGSAVYKGGECYRSPSSEVGEDTVIGFGATLFALARKDDGLIYKEKRGNGQITEGLVEKLKEIGWLEFKKMLERLKKPAKGLEVFERLVRGPGDSETILSIDLDGNGKPDLIGHFGVLLGYEYKGNQENKRVTYHSFDMLYILYDNGKGEILWPSFQNGIWYDGYAYILGFFNVGERRPSALVLSCYPMEYVQYACRPNQYEILAHRNGKGWVTIFKGRSKRCVTK
jgi:hypothetical protein